MRRITIGMLLLAGAIGVARADFEEGALAYAMGDYERAAQIMLTLAETADDPYAQYYLGQMYANGQGVEQDYEKAARYLRAAAEKGVAPAQYKLGRLYARGKGVPRDMERAYAWYAVAAHIGNPRAKALMDAAREKLSAEELAAAERLASELTEKYGTPPGRPGDGNS